MSDRRSESPWQRATRREAWRPSDREANECFHEQPQSMQGI